jgi:cytochrome c553
MTVLILLFLLVVLETSAIVGIGYLVLNALKKTALAASATTAEAIQATPIAECVSCHRIVARHNPTAIGPVCENCKRK